MMPSQNHLTFQWFNFATYHTIGGDPNHFSVEPLKLIILVTEGSDLCTAQKNYHVVHQETHLHFLATSNCLNNITNNSHVRSCKKPAVKHIISAQ